MAPLLRQRYAICAIGSGNYPQSRQPARLPGPNNRTRTFNEFISKYMLPTGIIPDAPTPTLLQ